MYFFSVLNTCVVSGLISTLEIVVQLVFEEATSLQASLMFSLNSALLRINTLPSCVERSPPLVMCLRVLHSTVLKRQVSPEELQTPGGPFLKKTFTVSSDRFFGTLQNKHECAETRVESHTFESSNCNVHSLSTTHGAVS